MRLGLRRIGGAALLLVSGCRANAGPASADASAEAASAAIDAAALPETVVVYLEAGVEPDGRSCASCKAKSSTVVLLSGLPRPCVDKQLGTVTFAQSDDDIVITSSKTKARATCRRIDEHKLSCDWLGKDGRPSVQQKIVTYGPKTKIGGSYDKTHAFSCPAEP